MHRDVKTVEGMPSGRGWRFGGSVVAVPCDTGVWVGQENPVGVGIKVDLGVAL